MASRKNKTTEVSEEERHGFIEGAREYEDVRVPEFMNQTRIPYAWSVIRERALIDSRDGLKPVQRRILWTLYEDNVLPSKEFMKVARLAGNVLRYHPHANTAVEDALVRMAQKYSLRVPLIDGKGSFGAHPGDEAAASRYIEARLDREAIELLDEVKTGAVRMVPNFDETLQEPEVLPVRWPVAVINGSSGIAVGYAANLAQHNPTETLKACKLLLKNPDASIKQLMRVMPGPDFWTGGRVIGTDGIAEYYETGRGKFIVEAKYTVEQQARGKVRFTFTELPPDTSCESIVEKVRSLIKESPKFKAGISRVDNLTGRVNDNDVRLVIETKAGANSKEILAELFKKTGLRQSYSVNNTVVCNGRPQVMGIKELLLEFLDLRKDCVLNRSKHYMERKNARIHQIEGLLTILLDIDAAIAIIRKSDGQDDARAALMKKFKIDEGQANYVLDMQLRRLTRQDSVALNEEKAQLEEDVQGLEKIVNDPEELNKVIVSELDKEAKIIGRPRMMEIVGMTMDEAKEAEKAAAAAMRADSRDSKCYVYSLADGKTLKSFVKLPGKVEKTKDRGLKVLPAVASFHTTTKSALGVFGSDGVEYPASMSYLEEGKPTSPSTIGAVPTGVKQIGIIPDGEATVLLVSREGSLRKVRVTGLNDRERVAMQLDKGDSLIAMIDVTRTVKNATLILITEHGRGIRLDLDSINPVGPGAKGIKGIGLKDDDKVIAACIARKDSDYLLTVSKHSMKVTPLSEIPVNGRGGMGSIFHSLVGADRITMAGVDALLLKGDTMVTLPSATRRAGRTAPVPTGVKLLTV